MRRATFLVGLLACLAGCAPPGEPVADPNSDAQGKRFEPPSQGMAALYVVRGNDLPGTLPIAVSVGSRQLGTLASNTWLRVLRRRKLRCRERGLLLVSDRLLWRWWRRRR